MMTLGHSPRSRAVLTTVEDTTAADALRNATPRERARQINAIAARLGLDPLVDEGEGQPGEMRSPITFSETPAMRYIAPPRLGHHSDDVRRWFEEEERP